MIVSSLLPFFDNHKLPPMIISFILHPPFNLTKISQFTFKNNFITRSNFTHYYQFSPLLHHGFSPPLPSINLSFTQSPKASTPPSIYRQLFQEILETFPDPSICYNDGSKIHNKTAFIVIFVWVPGHAGVPGNQVVDEAAKQASQFPYISKSLLPPVLTSIQKQWFLELKDSFLRGKKLARLKDTPVS